jgi:hypothetical protein
MNIHPLVKAVRRPFRPLKRLYLKGQDKARFQAALRPSDTFIVGHPKSGNTLVAYMLAIASFKDRDEKVNLANLAEYVPILHDEDSTATRYGSLPNPRLFRNEVPHYPHLYPKTIYLVRDPRAALVSYYHMYKTIFDDDTSMEDFVTEYLREGCIKRYEPQIVRWDRQLLQWVARAKQGQQVIVVKYEEVVKRKEETLRKMLAFAGVPFSQEEFDLVIARSSFEAMRKTEEKYGEESFPGEIGKRGRFVRKGKTEGWKEELPERLVAAIQQEFAPAMRTVGYS